MLACGSGQSALVLGATFGGGWAGGGVQAGCGVNRWALLAYKHFAAGLMLCYTCKWLVSGVLLFCSVCLLGSRTLAA